jgi:hypothetical protein
MRSGEATPRNICTASGHSRPRRDSENICSTLSVTTRAATGARIKFGQATERTVPELVNRLRSRTGQAASSSNKTHSATVSRLKKQ